MCATLQALLLRGSLATPVSAIPILAVTISALLMLGLVSGVSAQNSPSDDGRPDLSGIWQALGTAYWDLEGHAARAGGPISMGAHGAVPAGLGVVVGGEIPYLPEAAAKKKENLERWMELDPALKCFMPGVPRAMIQPFPMQIAQTPETILIAHEFASAVRVIHMNQPDRESPLPTWMGHSLGRWEGNSLVVEVTDQVPDTWFDRSGNFHSEGLKVTERFTPRGPDHLIYEATIHDPEVFSRPWKISLPLYRRIEENAQLLEFKCVGFVEEMMFGHLTKEVEE